MPEIVVRAISYLGHIIREYREETIAIGTIFIALYTAILAHIGRGQSKETKILQRAYIAVHPLGIVALNREMGDGQAVAHIAIENVGRLPAREVKWAIRSAISDERYRQGFAIKAESAFGGVTLPPGTRMLQGSDALDVNDGYEGKRAGPEGPFLYVWGAVFYRDGFEGTPSRITRFCHRYNFDGPPSGDLGYFFRPEAARIHRYGNDAE